MSQNKNVTVGQVEKERSDWLNSGTTQPLAYHRKWRNMAVVSECVRLTGDLQQKEIETVHCSCKVVLIQEPST